MSAIEQCRTAALGGHVLRCPDCQHDQVSYNSCRNRHCPKCQANAAKRWLEARQADLLPVETSWRGTPQSPLILLDTPHRQLVPFSLWDSSFADANFTGEPFAP